MNIMKKKTVLLVDDEPRLLESSAKLFQDHFNIIKSSNGRQALECVEREKLDCIVLDIMMPEMNGVEFLKRLRDKSKNTPVIVVTGQSCIDYVEQCADLGVNSYVKKPYDIDDLTNRIHSLVNSNKTSDEDINFKEFLENIGHPKVREVVAYIHGNYSQAITINSLSSHFGICSSYLGTLFKKYLGFTFTEYVNKLRIEESKKLIEEPGFTISEISKKMGFSTEQHFFKQFKKYTGTTPRKLKK